MAWSGGKDCMMALHTLQESDDLEVAVLLTTVNEAYQRVSMHGVRLDLIEAQADALGLPLEVVFVPEQTDNATYEQRMGEALTKLKADGMNKVAFGDIFLEDLRAYREQNIAQLGMEAVFPLWQQNSRALVGQFVALGYRAYTVCVDGLKLGQEFAGRLIDNTYVESLPEGIDPCGENGEFHSFVFDGPLFNKALAIEKGALVVKTYEAPYANEFVFCDLTRSDGSPGPVQGTPSDR